MQMLDEDQMVGIWGTGGIGKTTLAKNIYNQIANGFECCCFLGDIRENSKNGGLLKLQEKLVSQLLGQQNHHFTSTDEGIDVLKSRVRGKKALILLDDVDAIDQIEALSADPNWFGKGSRILITTRDQAVLKQYEWCKIYEHKPLNEDLALKLFSKYAFKHELPTREFVDLSKDIVRITGRLPLTLKVTGSTLFTFRGKKDLWLDAKTKLKKGAHVAEDVRKKLMISYEYLDDDQKKIFLDIACFFIGTNYRQLIPMWENCGLSPTLEIEVLKYKSLIKIDDGNEIQMHDELRDLGRHIVDQQGRKPEQRSRLWRNREVFDILHGRKGTENIEGALISEMESRESLHDECFQNLSELRILIVHGDVEIVGDCQHLLPNLRWLRWSNRERYPPNNLPLNKLVVLDLSGCVSLDDDWIGWISIKSGSMGALTVLTIDGTGIQELPVSAKMKRLEFLSANRCRELDRIPESIGSLVNLKQLSLEQCTNLKKLPETIGKLRSLIELRLFDSRITCLPKTLEYLTNLEVMDARFCPSLYEEVPFEIGGHAHSRFLTIFLTKDRKLSDRISSFSHLHTLYLFVGRHWTRMDLPKLPSSLITLDIQGMRRERHIGSISPQVIDKDSTDHVELKQDFYKLEELRLMRVNIITLPKGISSFTRLKRVTIKGCEKLKCLPTLPSNLCHLIVENCQCLCELSDLSNLDWLLQLSISECPAIEGLPGLSKLQSLKYLHLIGCKKLAQLNGIGELTSLEELKIHDNEELKELSEPQWKLQSLKRMEIISCTRLTHLKGDLISLESLELRECNAIGELSKLSKMLKLQSLRIKGCEKLKTLDEIGELVSLQELGISRCSILELPELFKLVSLKFIVLAHCRNLTQLDGIQGLISLKVLIIHWCDKITRLGEMGELVSLRRLDIIRCNNIENLPETLGPSSLEELTISECKKLTRLGGIRDSVSLKELHIDRCKNIENLAEALKLQSLEKLKICGQTKMTPPGRIVDLVLLKELCINECENIENLVEALKLRSIEKLEIACCMKLTQLNGIVDLVSLKELHIFKCGNIGNLAEALKLPNLEKMHITCCTKLTQLSGIVDLVSLKELYIKQCVNLENLAEALNLPSLEELNIDDCEKLSKLGGIVNLVSLKELGISYCNRIENLPEVLKLESLKILKVTNCESLEGLDGIGESISLEELYIKSCGKVEELSNLSKLQSLRYLEASECRELTRLDGIGELVSLERLDIRGCEIIMEELPELSKLQSLKCLHMSLVSLTRLDRIGDLASLENLDMTHWRSIKEFPKLLNLVQLQELGMHHCESLNQLYGIRELVSLRSLSISYCRGIEMLPDLSQMCKLRKLSIEECENLIQLEGLELENLIHLEINGCCKLKDLPNISKLSRLLRLCIQGCHQLSHLEGLGELISLEYLIITRCEELEKLPDLSKLQLLECFLMINCKNIKGLQGFQKLSDQLEVIRIFRCPHLQYLSSYNCRGDVYYKDLNLFLSFKDLKTLQYEESTIQENTKDWTT
ncbi:hypothetical protein SAY86_023985 [Trapa natans]|uniref:NB-ARC domain-containing protein n=1 Tax=Trapa natans TaxID=22666 RepID=A0AAN7R9U0_TRANT|nr:hypothetical protein SAY86_023985 [Trapa natans]